MTNPGEKTDWTEKNSEEMCELLGVEYHNIDVNHESGSPYCLTCDTKYSECPKSFGRDEVERYSFRNPCGKELGVMLEWCLEKGLIIVMEKVSQGVLISLNGQNTTTAPTKELALREAIRAYGREG